jgi:hypothetical protein
MNEAQRVQRATRFEEMRRQPQEDPGQEHDREADKK